MPFQKKPIMMRASSNAFYEQVAIANKKGRVKSAFFMGWLQ